MVNTLPRYSIPEWVNLHFRIYSLDVKQWFPNKIHDKATRKPFTALISVKNWLFCTRFQNSLDINCKSSNKKPCEFIWSINEYCDDGDVKIWNCIAYINLLLCFVNCKFVFIFLTLQHYNPLGSSNTVAMLNVFINAKP